MAGFLLKLNRSGCIGCGACASICHNVFEMIEDGKSSIKGGRVGDESEVVEKAIEGEDVECAKNAAQACPVEVIEVVEEGGNEGD